MQGYTWSSNQRPPPQYQEPSPPQYQEPSPPQYQARPPPHYQERSPPQYQERPPLHYQEQTSFHCDERPPLYYQEQFQPKYQDVRNEQPNMFQAQFNTQHYTTSQTRYSNGQQEASNHCQSFQSNLHGYNTQTNQTQYPCAASYTQHYYPSENPNTNGYHAQFATQSNVSSPQNYGNTDRNQAHMYRSPQSDHGSSVGNNRSWRYHTYNNGSSCSMKNQQQLQPPRTAPHHHQQQQFSRQHSGKKHKKHRRTQGHHPQSSSWTHNNGVPQRISNNQAQSQTVASYTSCNSTTPPSGAQSEISLPSNNLNQSTVTHNQPELRSNAGPDVSATHSQNKQSTEQQSQGTNGGTFNNETSQMTWTNEARSTSHSRFVNSIIYQLLSSNVNEQAGKQLKSDERNAHHNTCSEQPEVCATNRTDYHSHFSEPSVQCTVEPPCKRMKHAVVQRDYWNKETSVSKVRSDFGVQSVRPGTHQTCSNTNRPKGMSQHNIQYSTDPADCLEAVFALKKVSQQVHKAIAIVPPISQQSTNTAQMADTSPKKADSPPLKIDSVWSVVEESDAQKTVDDKLPESPSPTPQQEDKSSPTRGPTPQQEDKSSPTREPTPQQEDKSLEIETTSNIADSDICSTRPVECQNNVQQGDCDSSDTSFDLSSVPVVKYTLGNLMDLVKSLEITELSTEYPEKSESFIDRILKLYWNGSKANLVEALKSFRKEVEQHSSADIVMDYESVVFENIETENLKKLAHCDVLNDEMYSSSEEYKSSWLNVDGQPADIEKVLSEPLLLDDITVTTSQLFSDNTVATLANLGGNSLKDVPKGSSAGKSVKPDTCSPTALFTPQSGTNREEIATGNNGHSYAGLSRMTSLSSISNEKGTSLSSVSNRKETSLSSFSSEKETFLSSISKETFKKQEDIKQNHNFNTNPSDNFPLALAERSTEKRTACRNEMELFRKDHYEQTHHNVSVSDSLPLSPEDNVSDGVKNSEESFSTETLCNSKDTWLIEDISEDENPGNKVALNNSSNIGLVEDISEDENPCNKETLNSSNIGLVEDISDDENPGNKVALNNSSNIGLVEDISEDENPGNKETLNSSNIGLVEDISDDENPGNKVALNNSSNIGLVEDISEDENPGNKEALNSSNIGLVEAISDDENPGNKEALPISSDIWLVEDISDDDNTRNMEALPISSDIWYVEDISDDDNTGNMKVLPISSDIWDVEDISDDGNPGNKDTRSNSPDICVVEDVSNDENSRDDSTLMEITVLSSEDAKTFFQQLEDEPVCSIKTTTSKFDCPDLVACFDVPSQPSNEYNKDICSLCGTKMAISNSTVTNSDGDLFCLQCWEQAPLLELEEQPCSPMTNEADVLVPPAKSNKQGQDCIPPCVKLEVKELNVASTKECIVDERLTGHLVKSEQGQNSPSLEPKDKELKVALPETCVVNEGLTGQKRDTMVKSELGQTRSPPFLDLKVKEQTVTSTKKCIVDGGLTGQKRDTMVKSELGQTRSLPFLDLKVKEQTVTTTKKCIVDEGLTGQRSDHLVKSELGQNSPSLEPKEKKLKVALPETCVMNEGLTGQKRDTMVKPVLGQTCSPPFLDLKVKEQTVTTTKKCIVDEGLTGQKIDTMVKSELGQTRSPPFLDLKVKEQTVTTTKKCIVDEGLTGQRSDHLVKSELGQYRNSPSLEVKVNEPTVASTEECIDDERLMGHKSLFKSELRQNCSPPSLRLQVKMPNVYSTEERTENERLTERKRENMVKSELRQNCSPPSLQLEANEPTVASTEERTEDERLMEQKSEHFLKLGLKQNCSSSRETQVKVPNVASPEYCVADEGLTGQKSDSMVKSATQKVPEIQRPAEQKKNDKTEKNRKHRCNTPPPNKSAFSKHKRAMTVSDDSVLFAPDIVVKKIAKKRPSGGSQDCSKVKKYKEHRQKKQDCPDRTSSHHRENLQKVTKKVSSRSNDTQHQKSKNKLELCSILLVTKTKPTEPKKVRFDLFGSNGENVSERRLSAPVTLTVSDNCKEYTDGLSAKQKVHNQWSSTFIPKTKTFSPRSTVTQKKKTQKSQDSINMTALKSHLTHRASLQSSSERERNHFRKPGFHQKLTKSLSS